MRKSVDLNTGDAIAGLSQILDQLDRIEAKLRSIKSLSTGAFGVVGGAAGIGTGGAAGMNAGGLNIPTGASVLLNSTNPNPGGTDALSSALLNNSFQRQAAGGILGYAGLDALQGGLNYATRTSMTGGMNAIEQGGLVARTVGSVIGGGIGYAFGGPIAGAAGAAVVGKTFEDVGRWLAAPTQQHFNALGAQWGVMGPMGVGGLPKGETPPAEMSPIRRNFRFFNMADELNKRWDNPTFGSPFHVTPDQLAGSWASVSSGMLAGGSNPFAATGTKVYGPSDDDISKQSGKLAIEMAKTFKILGMGREQAGEMYMRRLGSIYGGLGEGKLLEEASGRMGKIFGTMPETGGNIADILKEFGPQDTSLFLRIQNDKLKASVDPIVLAQTSGAIRGAERDARFGSLQARSSGTAMVGAYRSEMAAIATLPGGSSSLQYAETAAKARDAGRAEFEQAGMAGYGLESAHIRGALDRMQVMPFSAGNQLMMEGANIRINRAEVNRIGRFMNSRRASGDLSESEELDLTERQETLRTNVARSIGHIAMGMENRLPAMTAGRPAHFRGDSMSLAAMRMQGTPVRIYGAVGGRHAADQDAAWEGTGAGVGTSPTSRTGSIGQSGHSLDRAAAALERAAAAIERSVGGGRPGSGARFSDVSGSAAAALGSRDLGQQRLYRRAN